MVVEKILYIKPMNINIDVATNLFVYTMVLHAVLG